MVNSNIGPNSAPFRDMKLRNLSDLDFDLSRSPKVYCLGAIGLPIHGFLFMFNNNMGLSRLLCEILGFKIWVTLNLTFQGHLRSNVMVSFDSLHMVSY